MVPPDLASRIDSVTVFVHGALITRHADLAGLEGRPRQLRLTGLPLCLEDATLRVVISGGAAIATDVQVVLDLPPLDPALPPPQDTDLIAARRAVAESQVRLDLIDEQRVRLERVDILERPVPQRGSPPATSPTAARLALVEFATRRAERLTAEHAAASEAHRLAKERLAELEARAAAASSARQARPEELRKSAVVTLRWQGEGAPIGTLTLDYRVPGARWMPTYVVRFDAGMNQATVQMRAALAQASGEDWSNVRLTLSTADSLAWHALPELASRRIGRRQSRPPAIGWRSAPEGAEDLYADYDRERQRLVTEVVPLEMMREASSDSEKEPQESARGGGRMAKMAASPAPVMAAAPMPSTSTSESISPLPPEGLQRRRVLADKVGSEEHPSADGFGSPGAEPAQHWLAFGSLRLASPDDPDRGRLRPAKTHESYLAVLVEQRVTLSTSVLSILRQADSRAQAPQHLPTPAEHAQSPQAGRFAYVYPAALPVSVVSDAAWHVVPVAEHVATVEVGHVCVPREAREVFRVARFINPAPAPLPAGPADCYAGEHYLMTVPLSGVDSGGAVTLGLGVEPGISVARNTSVSERSSGLLSGTLNVDHRIRIRVANKLQRPAAIEVRERLPVSASEDCTVKTGEVKPPWQDWAQTEAPIAGGHCWRITVAPATETELAVDYSVTFPAKHEIVGGNRREGTGA